MKQGKLNWVANFIWGIAEPKGINDEVVIDLEALRAQMKHVYNVLHSLQLYLIETHGMNAEWQAEMNSW